MGRGGGRGGGGGFFPGAGGRQAGDEHPLLGRGTQIGGGVGLQKGTLMGSQVMQSGRWPQAGHEGLSGLWQRRGLWVEQEGTEP